MKIGRTMATVLVIAIVSLHTVMPAAAENTLQQLVAMISDRPAIVTAEPDDMAKPDELAPAGAEAHSDAASGGEELDDTATTGGMQPDDTATSDGKQQPDDTAAAEKEENAGPGTIGIVTLTSGNLNVRKGPSLDEEIIGKLPDGAIVDVLEPLEDWVKIPYDGKIAYVAKPYLVMSETGKRASGPAGNVIVLDPGHGGKDPGAIARDGTYESELVWKYTIKAKGLLEKSGYVVWLTRGERTSCAAYRSYYDELACRAAFADKVKGDIFISIHADSHTKSGYRGTATFYNARDDFDGNQNPFSTESRRLARIVHDSVRPAIGSEDRGIANKNYYVTRMNTVPSILIELAYLSNSSDLKLLQKEETGDKFAKALVKAVDEYFGQSS